MGLTGGSLTALGLRGTVWTSSDPPELTMRKSKAITLSILGLGTFGLASGCGTSEPPPSTSPDTKPSADPAPTDPAEVTVEPDDTWYDPQGNRIPEEWTVDATGKRVPVQHPHDQFGRPWVYDSEGNLVPPPQTTVRTTRLFGPIVFIHGVPGGRSGGTLVTRSGFGSTGGRIGPSTS
jgi:hypothetical protein